MAGFFNWDEGCSGRLEGVGENNREGFVMAIRLFLLLLDCLRGVDIIEEKGMGEDGQWRVQ
ncbi:hypothetical protein [Paenibacillus illinoisensis]|uniref:hypothetical protein n=1 Tax=Paenibacillus illinoisensis TaxID=59845 RepID=UPI00301BE55F